MAVVDDPSNRDPVFARARLRALGPARTALGLETPALLRLAARAARAEEALDAEARRCLAAIEPTSTATTFAARLAPLSGSPLEILLRVLRLALDGVVPGGRVARLERLETLASGVSDALKAGRGYRTTLNGACVVLRRDTMLVVVPEPARRRGRARQEAI